jgi:hypothetical protein
LLRLHQKMIDFSEKISDHYISKLYERHNLKVVNNSVKCPNAFHESTDIQSCLKCPWIEGIEEKNNHSSQVICNPPTNIPNNI